MGLFELLAINAAIIGFVIKSQSKSGSSTSQSQVSISSATLDKLGVNRSSVNNEGIKLIVNPDAQFNGKLQVNGDVSLAGQLKLNSKITAPSASVTTLEAGKTSLTDLNVNGDGTVTNLNVRNDLIVAGIARMQGTSVFTGLITANGNINVSGNLTVGGTLAVSTAHVSSLVVDGTIIIGGHVITQGSAPGVSKGSASVIGTNGTVSLNGNDQSGTVVVNVGVGSGSTGVATIVTFKSAYSNIPHVVISQVGTGATNPYVNRSATGFSIGVDSPLVPGRSYIFDYIVAQ